MKSVKTLQSAAHRSRIAGAAALVLCLSGGLIGASVQSAQAFAPPVTTGAPQFGSVDIGQVMNESKAQQTNTAEMNQLIANLRNVMAQLQSGSARFMSEAEIREYATLLEKPTPTEAEKKRMAVLQSGSDAKSAQLTRLESTPTSTDEQKKQFQDLTDSRQKGDVVLKAIADDMGKRVDARDAELQNKTVLEIRGIIAKIAQDKGLAVVFNSQVAFYTANDITADVIKQLNKK